MSNDISEYASNEKKLDQFKPNIIFCMTEFTMGLIGLNYGKKNHIPVVTNYSTNFTSILKSYKLGIFVGLLEKYLSWFHQEASLTVTPSMESETILKKIGVKNIKIFGRGIDFDQFSPDYKSVCFRKKLGIEDKITLLYVGRLSPEKDLDMLRKAMFLLNKQYKDKITLVITGEGPMKAELERTMPENVIFTGYKKGKDLAEIYASCDVFTFPSSFETFGNVVLEAFASGLPVVGVSEGGVKPLIIHSEGGYLSTPQNEKEFAEQIEKLILNEIERKMCGLKGRAFAKTKSWEAVFIELMDNFKKIISVSRELTAA